jgi:hypothetical protein
VDLESVGGRVRRVVAPQDLDQTVAGNHPIGLEEEGAEYRLLAAPGERHWVPLVIEDL